MTEEGEPGAPLDELPAPESSSELPANAPSPAAVPGGSTGATVPDGRQRPPLWAAFLTPVAVLLGSIVIAGAIWYTDDDATSSHELAAITPGGESTVAEAASTAPGASTQDLLTTFTGYAKEIGLDTGKFQQCVGKQEKVQLISTQLQRGTALGVNGTPTFFVNNKRIEGAQPAAVFDEVIAAELKGSPTTLDGYSATIKALAATTPPRFEILSAKVDVSDAAIDGDRNAKVMVAEFSDFQCPFCKRWNDDYMKRLRSQLGKDVAVAFLHFPITQIHPNAGNASLVAICAGEQGKFWQMHDILFARQSEWSKAQ